MNFKPLLLADRARAALRRAFDRLTSPAAVIVYLIFGGSVCGVAGVCLLYGLAWAFIASAVISFALAALLLRGVSHG